MHGRSAAAHTFAAAVARLALTQSPSTGPSTTIALALQPELPANPSDSVAAARRAEEEYAADGSRARRAGRPGTPGGGGTASQAACSSGSAPSRRASAGQEAAGGAGSGRCAGRGLGESRLQHLSGKRVRSYTRRWVRPRLPRTCRRRRRSFAAARCAPACTRASPPLPLLQRPSGRW